LFWRFAIWLLCCGLGACGRIGYDGDEPEIEIEIDRDGSTASSADVSALETSTTDSRFDDVPPIDGADRVASESASEGSLPEGAADAGRADASIADAGARDADPRDADQRDVTPAMCTERNASVDPATGHCYFVTPGTAIWSVTRDACAGPQMHLVTMGSASEQAFVENWLTQIGGVRKDLWIGLFQAGGAPFEWVTGEPVVYTNWGAGEPNDGPDDCGRIQAGGAWADWSLCDARFAGVCEREP
jgi:hypothetical protein